MSTGKSTGKSTSRKGQGRGGQKENAYTTSGLAAIFDVLRERGIDLLPPAIRAHVERIKARRPEPSPLPFGARLCGKRGATEAAPSRCRCRCRCQKVA
jgi:hypothetical protein